MTLPYITGTLGTGVLIVDVKIVLHIDHIIKIDGYLAIFVLMITVYT